MTAAWISPATYIQGPGELTRLGTRAASYGKHALLLCDSTIHERYGTCIAGSFSASACTCLILFDERSHVLISSETMEGNFLLMSFSALPTALQCRSNAIARISWTFQSGCMLTVFLMKSSISENFLLPQI